MVVFLCAIAAILDVLVYHLGEDHSLEYHHQKMSMDKMLCKPVIQYTIKAVINAVFVDIIAIMLKHTRI